MNTSKVLIIGASGFVGKALHNEFAKKKNYNVYGTYFKNKKQGLIKLDIRKKENVKKLFKKIKPDIVLLPASLPHVDLCEEKKRFTYGINVIGAKNVAESCASTSSKLVYFSSDYVFDGKNGPYKETDELNPISEYGRQKAECESIIKKNLKNRNYIIVRTSVVFGYDIEGKNFAMQTIKSLSGNEKRKVPIDQYSHPTYAKDIARACCGLIGKNKNGIYNIVGDEHLSRYEFALKIAEAFGLDKSLVMPVKTEELGQSAKRPLNAGLYNHKIKKDIKIKFHTIAQALEEIKEAM